ncbi:hypothetical protein, partial [Streptomyces eurythermus]|uniref:hypothetical protein n=1 Tax=Streptomyces eurythermus TaxID=42237 RepID=UPI00340CA412
EAVPSNSPKETHDVAAYDGEEEDSGVSRPQHLRSNADDAVQVEDKDADVFWEDIAEAVGRTGAAVNLVGRKGVILWKKRRSELSGGSDAEEDAKVVRKEQELRKSYKQLLRSRTQDLSEGQVDDSEGRRRSKRQRKRVDFPDKVSWKNFCAERSIKHKITMTLRSLAGKGRRVRPQQGQANGDAEADVHNGRTGPAEQRSEQKAAEMHAVTPEPTVTGLQETAMALTACSLATPDASSDNEASTKRHNTETYDEDCLLSDDEAPAILARKAQPKLHLHSSASPDLRVTKRAPKPWTMPEFTVGLRETQAIFAELEDMA